MSDVSLVHLKQDPLFETVLPSKLFEPMAMAKPILLGVDGEARRVLEASHAGIYFEPENETDFLAALNRIRADGTLARQMGERGVAFVKQHYDRESLATQCVALFHREIA